MKKTILTAFSVMIITVFLVISVSASKPYWYPEEFEYPFPDFHGENLKRVVDDADMFSDSEEAALTEMINGIIDKYGYDLVLFTDVSTYGEESDGIYAADFYQFNGYGKGDDYSGSVIFISLEPGNRYWWTAARGSSRGYFIESNINAIDDRIEPYMVDGDYYAAMTEYFKCVGELYENGEVTVPRGIGDYVGVGIIGVIISLVVGALYSGGQVSKMKKVQYAAYANDYIKKNSFVLRNKKVTFLYKNVSRTYSPQSSSSGGRSSYSGGYHSSGGGSFSGGGRHF